MLVTEENVDKLDEQPQKLEQKIIDNIRKSIVPTERLIKGTKLLGADGIERYPLNIRCYPYTLGITYTETIATNNAGFNKFIEYNPGFTAPEKIDTERYWEDLMDLVKRDLENLHIKYREILLGDDISLRPGEFLIKAFIKQNEPKDFHFVRYSPKDKTWFHKVSYFQPEIIDKAILTYFPMGIEFREESIYKKEPESIWMNHDVYEPLGYFAIREP